MVCGHSAFGVLGLRDSLLRNSPLLLGLGRFFSSRTASLVLLCRSGLCRVSSASELGQADLVIRSPGVPVHSRDMARLRRLVTVTTMTDLWMRRFGSRTVAITGTKGKSTTTSLLTTLLNAAGVVTRAGGNIGSPLVPSHEFLGDAQFMVAEVSSYQAADLNSVPAHTALTSFHADHLDWHGSLASIGATNCGCAIDLEHRLSRVAGGEQ